MAVSGGKEAVLQVAEAGAGTVLTDITTYLTSVSGPDMDGQVAEVSTLGDQYKSFIRTQIDPGSFACEGVYEHTIGTILDALELDDDGEEFAYYPQGTASGKTKISGTAFLTTYSISADRDDAALFSASWKISGTVTVGTA